MNSAIAALSALVGTLMAFVFTLTTLSGKPEPLYMLCAALFWLAMVTALKEDRR